VRYKVDTAKVVAAVRAELSSNTKTPEAREPATQNCAFLYKALTYGVQGQRIEGVPVRVFTPAKTVADCFRYGNKIGLDVALGALRDCKRKRKATTDEIWKAAKVC
jgi:hypothetical protein